MFKRLHLSRAERVGKMLLVGVGACLYAMIIGSQAEQYPDVIHAVSLLPKTSTKLLSVFRLGLIMIARCTSIKLALQLVLEIR